MALVHKTVIGGLTIDRSGSASLLVKMTIIDDLKEFSPDNHRFYISRGENLVVRGAEINTILAEMGRAPLAAKDSNVIRQTLLACWAAMDA
jgi:hypothetical protein